MSLPPSPYPVTPDRRYFVVRGRLWRMANPDLPELERARLVADLMQARREVGKALRGKDLDAQRLARQAVDAAKHGLGERGRHGARMACLITTGAWCAIRPMRGGMPRWASSSPDVFHPRYP